MPHTNREHGHSAAWCMGRCLSGSCKGSDNEPVLRPSATRMRATVSQLIKLQSRLFRLALSGSFSDWQSWRQRAEQSTALLVPLAVSRTAPLTAPCAVPLAASHAAPLLSQPFPQPLSRHAPKQPQFLWQPVACTWLLLQPLARRLPQPFAPCLLQPLAPCLLQPLARRLSQPLARRL
jgi:hypothetical protein